MTPVFHTAADNAPSVNSHLPSDRAASAKSRGPLTPHANATWRRAFIALSTWLILLLSIRHGMDLPSIQTQSALSIAAAALVAWTVLRWDDTRVALLAALALVASQVISATQLFASLGDPIIWLLLGAFVLSAVLRASGVAERVVHAALHGCTRFERLCWRLCWVIAATAWIIPSTSARAAVLLPVYLVLAQALPPRQARALALLFPTVILLSAGGALLGAGAHLVTAEFVRTHSGARWHWLSWSMLAAPFALGSCAMATTLVLRLFLSADERCVALPAPRQTGTPWTPTQIRIAAIAMLAVLGWALGPWLGVDAALVSLVAALLATTPQITGFKLAAVLKQVEWQLLLFMAATLVLGQALLHTGAAGAMAAQLISSLQLQHAPPAMLLALAATTAVAAHLLVPSRTARAVVLLPTVVLPLAATGLNLALLAMVVVQGTGFCQTLSASAKPVAVFSQAEGAPFGPADLLKLAAALAPLMVLWLMVNALWLWPLQGLN